MRIAHVITRLIVGGAQENTIASVLGLRQKPGLTLQLIAGPTTGPEGSLEPTVAAVPGLLHLVPELVRPVHPWNDWLAFRRLVQLFRQWSPDLVHTHSGKAGVLGRLAAQRAGVPLIVHTVHGPSFGAFQNAASNVLFRLAEGRAARCTTHFVTVAHALTCQYLAANIGRPEQYTRILSGFDLAPYRSLTNNADQRARLGLAPDDLVVGMIARLFKLKGHDDLFAIAPQLVRRCPRLKFLLVGNGPWRARFERRAEIIGLRSRFVFVGLVPPEEVPRWVGAMDMLVHLSRREGLPRALPQALAAARPVVAYDCDGASEVCLEGETGFLVRPGDTATLTERLLELAGNPTLRERFGRRGQTLVLEWFPVQRMVDELHALYLRLAAQRTR